ncbi:MAG TPA: hypothetical protein VGF24_09665 [Vicinamibacterales bacterium]|jgi:hypothetical protein
MGNIGIPEILIGLIVVGVPLWAYRGFTLPKIRIIRYALLLVVAGVLVVLVFNWTTRFHTLAY